VQPESTNWRLLLPFYVGMLGMAGSTVAALDFALDSPDFIARAHLLVLLGLTASFFGASVGRNPGLVGAVVAVIVFPALVMSNTGAPSTRLFFPDEALTDHSLLLPTLAVWGIIALAFAQVNRTNAIFVFVCGLVVFGLTGTVNINESLLASFAVFLLSTFFVWGYDNLLSLRQRAAEAGQSLADTPARWANTQVGAGVALIAVVSLLALATGYPAYKYSRSFFIGPFQRSFLRPPPIIRALRNYSGFDEEFTLTGGPIQLDDTPALTVEADAPGLWRGLVYDRYNSRGWSRTYEGPAGFLFGGDSDGWYRARHSAGLEQVFPQSAAVQRNHQRVAPHIDTGNLVIAAAQPVAVRSGRPERGYGIDRYGCIRGWSRRANPRPYEVVSVSPVVSEEELKAAGGDYPESMEAYLHVPALTLRELDPLAQEITRDCRNPYEKAIAIQKYLYEECRYTLDVPPIPASQDAVAYFLLTTKIGACDLYSSSLAVLLRLSGVPARVATGYATGERDPTTGLYQVTLADAHAWTEVYFPGVGWVTFDPPSQDAPDRLSWLAKLFQPGWAAPMLRLIGRRVLTLAIAVLLINALIIAVSGNSPVTAAQRWLRRRGTRRNPRQRVAFAYEVVGRALRRRGLPRERWETPTAFARRISSAAAVPVHLRQTGLPQFTARFLALRYGAPEPSLEEVGRFEAHAESLARRIRRAEGMGQRRPS
jgi:hypothetical protein